MLSHTTMKALSPLRYPGGKGQMYDKIKHIIYANSLDQKTYVEPFAGGFAVGITLIRSNIVSNAIINDIDFHIYAFWKAVFFRTEQFIKKIESTPINMDEWYKQRAIYDKCNRKKLLDVAFATLFLNRTNFSGVLKAGPIGGQDQSGNYKMDCRFPKERICELIRNISIYKKRIKIYNMDANKFIQDVLKPMQGNLFINFDPPYVKKGKALYTNFYNMEDHRTLKKCITDNLTCDWIMTYDNNDFIKSMYKDFFTCEFSLGYSVNVHKKGTELFISPKEYKQELSA